MDRGGSTRGQRSILGWTGSLGNSTYPRLTSITTPTHQPMRDLTRPGPKARRIMNVILNAVITTITGISISTTNSTTIIIVMTNTIRIITVIMTWFVNIITSGGGASDCDHRTT